MKEAKKQRFLVKKSSQSERPDVFKIVGETADCVVVEKPAWVLVHPTEANEADTLVEFLTRKYSDIKNVGDNPKRPGIVHRLDKEASGLLVVARTQEMFEHLKKQFQDRTIDKEYLVLVYGKMERQHDVIDFAIDRGKDGRMVSRPKVDLLKLKSMRSVQPGKEALTEFTVEKEYGRFSLLRVKIHTGRTHQIRVHMFAYNHPVVGDNLYFNRKLVKKSESKLNRLFLHAAKLCFTDLAGERVCFESKLPEELEKYLKDI
ncbi:MAG: RNA pseudouridine synthase [Candidatus Magasanikbacteria bacterium]|nr:RNA pseudouridine synthase [Candidatus Magasanikbacteria bacterium]